MSHSEDNKMWSVIVYCQADGKISLGSADFSVRYIGVGGGGGGPGGGGYASNFQKDTNT